MRSALWRLAFALVMLPPLVASRELETHNPYKIEAAFLRNFAHYVTWPSTAFPKNRSSWHIGILGPDPFGKVMEETLEGRVEQGLPFSVFRADSLVDLPQCQIIYIAYKDARRRRAVLNILKDKPVLTVSEAEDFLIEGGVIRFQVNDKVSMGVNLDQAKRSLLSIQTKVLEVSRDILENGVVSRVR